MGDSGQWSPWRYLRGHHPDVSVHEAELPDGYMGCTDHRQRVIWLDTRLTAAERRCTLAHEIGHLELDVVAHGTLVTCAEDAADAWAARRLICSREFVQAFAWSCDLHEIAEELFVDVKTLRARIRCTTDEEQDEVMSVIARRHPAA